MTYFPTSYTGDGSTTDFAVTFEYAERSHVSVSVGGVDTNAVGSEYLFEWLNPTAIRVTSVVGSNPVPTDVAILIERNTPISDLPATFQGNTISTAVLLKNYQWFLFALQENAYGDAEGVSEDGWAAFSEPGFTLELTGGVRTQLNLGEGLAATVNSLRPEQTGHDFFASNKFQPIGSTPGGKYRLRINFDVISDVVNNQIKGQLDIGGAQGVIDEDTSITVENAGVTERATFDFDFYTFSTFIANGGSVFLQSSVDCSISNLTVLVIVEQTS